MKRTKYTIANWKMNGLNNSIKLVKSIENHIKKTKHSKSKIIICPPFPLLSNFTKIEKKISFGGQDCHYLNNGAFTGSISASMLKSIGCKYVIIGHSERRQYQNELSKELNLKIKSALASNLKVIYCIGEKFSEIKRRNKILAAQINSLPTNFKFKSIIIAYEPVWAIGTGKVPSLNQINNIHSKIRLLLAKKIGHNNLSLIHI